MPARIGFISSPGAAPRGLADWCLGGMGLAAATLSAGFACYMVAVGPAPRAPGANGGDFRVFVAFDRRPRRLAPADVVAPPPPAAPQVQARVESPAETEIDFTPTGSIAAARARTETPPALAGGAAPNSTPAGTLSGYQVRDVFDGKAVVEVRNRLTIVEPGSSIEGAGEVRAIRRGGAGWVVETAGGLIGQ